MMEEGRVWSCRTLYKMVQLYDTYSAASFAELIAQTDMAKYGEVVPFETAQMDGDIIVTFEMTSGTGTEVNPESWTQLNGSQ